MTQIGDGCKNAAGRREQETSIISTNNCPCGSGELLDACCGRYFETKAAPTAEALMRSRYSAHVLGKGQYLADTLSARQRADFDVAEFDAAFGQVKWLNLDVRAIAGGGPSDDTGTIEFIARFRERNSPGVHHELSTFIREDGRWVFDDCIMNPKQETRRVEKVGRNAPCPCGSGKKYKKCCGA
jgi:SEC-C motif domain protein